MTAVTVATQDETLSPAEASAFRARCQEFLAAHTAGGPARSLEESKVFLQAAADASLGGITYPAEYGGAGLTAAHDRIWREEKTRFPNQDYFFIISHGMCLPMLNEHGTPAQKQAFMADMIAGRTLWCQMFSEPGAGSDVASLQTRAVRDGDQWVVNGQKVWTTFAHRSDYGLIIARTDPDQPKHAGISMFILDMHDPGIEVRPIHQIDGGSNFNEVFFTDVRIPAEWMLGDFNNGWRMATSMLMYERVAIGSGDAGQIRHPRYDTVLAAARPRGVAGDPVVRDELMQIYILETCRSLMAMRTRAELKAGKTPGPGGSLGKLMGSVIAWRYQEMALDIAGPGSVAWPADSADSADGSDGSGSSDGSGGSGGGWLSALTLNSFSDGIAGGTDEIQRNIIGDRVLGLPREPAVDRDVPFRELKVGTQKSGS